MNPSELSASHDWLTFASDAGVVCLTDTNLLANITSAFHLGDLQGRAGDQLLTNTVDQGGSWFTNANLFTVVVTAGRSTCAFSTSHLKNLIFRTRLDLNALSTDEREAGPADAYLATLLGFTIARIRSEALRTLRLWNSVVATSHNPLTSVVDAGEALFANTHLVANSARALQLYGLVFWTNLDGHTDAIYSCKTSIANTLLETSRSASHSTRSTSALNLRVLVDVTLQYWHTLIVEQSGSWLTNTHLLTATDAV